MTMLVAVATMQTSIQAQQVTGIVRDEQGKGLEKTTVTLLRAKDSSAVKFNITDKAGNYSFSGATTGRYLVTASHVGFVPAYSKPFDIEAGQSVSVPAFNLIKAEGTLGGVTVVSKKPLVEVKADKTVLNVEGTINSTGSDALELLRKSPGVTVDKDDNLSLSGKSGVQVYIDGKPTPLSGSDLSNYLKSIQSSQIESIELITNPSAKYEAAGNAGIINIRLKKNKSFGANGSVNAGYNIGTYSKYNGGLSVNYRNRKINVYGNYNYNNSKNRNYLNLYRTTSVDSSFEQQSTMVNTNESHGFKAGLDYFAGKRSTVGVMVNGNFSDGGMNNTSVTDISFIPAKLVDRLLIARNSSNMSRDNMNFNANYRYTDTLGRELNVDADYGFFNSKTLQIQPNEMWDADQQNLLQKKVYRINTPSEIDIYSTKVDYEQNFMKGKLGLGGKFSYVTTDNTFQRFYETASLEDNNNHFTYKENINAVYANYNRPLKGMMIQLGLRVENTHSRGHSRGFRYDYATQANLQIDSLLDRNYTDPFPSASVTFNKNPMKQWSFSYSRRIDRPSYQNLNPFEFNLDEYTFQRGNPNLRPQYTNSFGVTHIYKYRLTTTLNYSHISDVFTMVPQNEGTKAFITNKNVAKQDIVSLNVSYPFQYKKYSLFVNLNTYYSKFKGDDPGFRVNLDVYSFNVYAQQSYKIAKATTLEMSGFYTAPQIWQGAFKSRSLGTVDMGIQQGLWKGKGTVKASVTDVFHTLTFAGTNTTTGQLVKVSGGWESRQFRVNFSYRFGRNQVKAARSRKSSTEDEEKRTQGGGGLGPGGK